MANEPENIIPAPPKLDLTARLKKVQSTPVSAQAETKSSPPPSNEPVAQISPPSTSSTPPQTNKTPVAIVATPANQQENQPQQPIQPKPVIQPLSTPTKAISIPKPPPQVSATPKISVVPKINEGASASQGQSVVSQQIPQPAAAGGATIKLQRPLSPIATNQPTQPKPIIQPIGPQTAPSLATGQTDAAATVQKPAAIDTRPPSKRETSKIPLELATAMNPATGSTIPKTIKIKPSIPQPSVAPITTTATSSAPVKAPTTPTSAEKRKTSRISLEAALGAIPAKPGEETPKTIKLKKPGEASTIKLATAPDIRAQEAPTISADAKSKTAKLEDLPPVTEEAESPTRRKTIKVKRAPGPSPLAPILTGEETADAGQSVIGGGMPQPVTTEDEPHWSFALIGVLSIIIAILVIWVLAAQVFGPDICLTKLSYGAPNFNLPWPGKIVSLH